MSEANRALSFLDNSPTQPLQSETPRPSRCSQSAPGCARRGGTPCQARPTLRSRQGTRGHDLWSPGVGPQRPPTRKEPRMVPSECGSIWYRVPIGAATAAPSRLTGQRYWCERIVDIARDSRTGACPASPATYQRRPVSPRVGRPTHIRFAACQLTAKARSPVAAVARCDGPIGCFCSFGLSLRDWKVRPIPSANGSPTASSLPGREWRLSAPTNNR